SPSRSAISSAIAPALSGSIAALAKPGVAGVSARTSPVARKCRRVKSNGFMIGPRLLADFSSPEHFPRYGRVPAYGIPGFLLVHFAARAQGTRPAGSLDLRQPAIGARNRNPVIRADQRIAGVEQNRIGDVLVFEQGDEGMGAGLGLAVGAEPRFGHGAHDGGIAQNMNVWNHS